MTIADVPCSQVLSLIIGCLFVSPIAIFESDCGRRAIHFVFDMAPNNAAREYVPWLHQAAPQAAAPAQAAQSRGPPILPPAQAAQPRLPPPPPAAERPHPPRWVVMGFHNKTLQCVYTFDCETAELALSLGQAYQLRIWQGYRSAMGTDAVPQRPPWMIWHAYASAINVQSVPDDFMMQALPDPDEQG